MSANHTSRPRPHGIVLTGPPGSGKSFIGTRLAELGIASYVELEPILVEKFGTGTEFLSNKNAAVKFIAESAVLAESG